MVRDLHREHGKQKNAANNNSNTRDISNYLPAQVKNMGIRRIKENKILK